MVEFSSTALRLLRKKFLRAESNLSITSDNKWYDDCKERGHCRLNFLHQFTRHVKAYDNICLVTPSFMHSHMVTSYRFFGGPYRFTWFGAFFNTIGPSLTKVVYAYFDRSSYIYRMYDNNVYHGYIHQS